MLHSDPIRPNPTNTYGKKRLPADDQVGQVTSSNSKGFMHRQRLNCFYTNAQGFFSKFPEVELRCRTSRWDFIAVTETWLTTDILDSELRLPGMEPLRRDRPSRGGGVLLYYYNKLQCG
ncbi:unnamed protein product [Echinostoma caproni]|uniref:Endo/exonuclease/phosphatase domain-containing protein n=1 Tax=Echinostoma caproni TaxID=27848 RepID=A0A183AEJ3_9TREM|nr:unnamed protein product [Echinostoma caproni]